MAGPPPLPDWVTERGTPPPPEDIRPARGVSKLRADLERLVGIADKVTGKAEGYAPPILKYSNLPVVAAERYGVQTPDEFLSPPTIQPAIAPVARATEAAREEQNGNIDTLHGRNAAAAAQIVSQRAAAAGLPEQAGPGGGGGGGPVGPQEVWRVGPQVRKAFGGAFGAASDAAAGEARVAAEQAAANEKLIAAQVSDDVTRANAQQAAEVERRQMLEDKANEYNAAVKELGDFRVDPQRYWTGKNVGEKIGSIVGIFLSGAAGAMDKSGRNRMVEELNKQRDIDIDAQKAEFGAKEAAARGKQTLFAMTHQRVGDERTADALARAAATERIQHEAQRIAAHYKGDEAKARLGTLLAGLEMEKAKFLSQAIAYQQPGGGGGGGSQNDTLALTPELESRVVQTPDGTFLARSKEAAEALRQLGPKVDQYVSNIQEMKSIRQQLKSNPFQPGLIARAQSLEASAKLVQKDVSKLGQIAGADVGLMESLSPSALSLRPGAEAGMDAAIKYTHGMYSGALGSQLSSEVATGYRPDKHGRQLPVFLYTGRTYQGASPGPQQAPTRVGETQHRPLFK